MNKDLLVDGKEYISASRAAMQIGYASDYIGQLCRGNKIPGRLIGRSWYVDFEALLDHKKQNKGKRRNKAKNNNISVVESTKKTKDDLEKYFFPPPPVPVRSEVHTSAVQSRSRIAEIQKTPVFAVRSAQGVNHLVLAVVFVVFLMVSIYIGGYVRHVVLTDGSRAESSYEAATFLSDVFGKVSQGIGRLLGRKESTDINQVQYGIVALPDQGDHAGIVARVKNSFSDEVEVTLDPEGDSGVIKPVFREGDATENYAFVMVPIRQQ